MFCLHGHLNRLAYSSELKRRQLIIPLVKITTMTVSSENKENKDNGIVQQVVKKQVNKSENAEKVKKPSTPVRKPRAVRSNRAADLRRDLKNSNGNQSMDKFVVGGSPKTTTPPKPLTLAKRNQNKPSPTNKTTKEVKQLNNKNITNDDVQDLSNKVNKLSTKSPLKDKKPKSESKKKSNVASPSLNSSKITDYFQYRKSERTLKKNFENQIQKDLENKINDNCQDGLEIKVFDDKGRGIVTTKEFFKGQFVLEYIGDLINKTAAKEREEKYSENNEIGCYMYYFKHKDTQYCIDATAESEKFGRLVNHSRKGANLISKIIEVNKVPHLVFFAKFDIPEGTEILYDYGDRSKNSIQYHPWLTK